MQKTVLFKKVVALVGVVLSLSIVIVSTVAFSPSPVFAGKHLDVSGDLGNAIEKAPNRLDDPILAVNQNVSGRRWNGLELFGDNAAVFTYRGEGPEQKACDQSNKSLFNYSCLDMKRADVAVKGIKKEKDFKKVAQLMRTGGNTISFKDSTGSGIFFSLHVNVFNLLMNIGFYTQGMMKASAQMVFNPHLICDETNTNTGKNGRGKFCIPLLNIIGGSDTSKSFFDEAESNQPGTENGGIIGMLTEGFYFPLAIIAVMITGIHVLWIALTKREFRRALGEAGYVFLSFIVLTMILLQPQLLVRVPATATNVIGTCLIGAVTGNGCGQSPSRPPDKKNGIDKLCAGSADGLAPDESAMLVSSNMSCELYKAFWLQPMSQAIFGVPLHELDTDTSDTMFAKAASDAGIDLNTYCVPMEMAKKVKNGESTDNITVKGDSVCNAMVYLMFLRSGVDVAGGDSAKPNLLPSGVSRWQWGEKAGQDLDPNKWGHAGFYNLIVPEMTSPVFLGRLIFGPPPSIDASGAMATFATLLGSVVMIVLAIQSIGYVMLGTVMMAFFPIFALLGLHPGKGKKIFLGYLAKVLSSIAKFAVIALLALMYIEIVGAILGTIDNMILGIVVLIALQVAMFSYKKSFMSLLGNIDLGGEALAKEKVHVPGSRKLKQTGKWLGTGLAVTTAGAIAGKMSGIGVKAGARSGAVRGFGRGTGVIAQATQQRVRANAEAERERRYQRFHGNQGSQQQNRQNNNGRPNTSGGQDVPHGQYQPEEEEFKKNVNQYKNASNYATELEKSGVVYNADVKTQMDINELRKDRSRQTQDSNGDIHVRVARNVSFRQEEAGKMIGASVAHENVQVAAAEMYKPNLSAQERQQATERFQKMSEDYDRKMSELSDESKRAFKYLTEKNHNDAIQEATKEGRLDSTIVEHYGVNIVEGMGKRTMSYGGYEGLKETYEELYSSSPNAQEVPV